MSEKDIILRVCHVCDAPLPNDKDKLNFYNKHKLICDDCIIIEKGCKGFLNHSLFEFK